MKRAFSAAMDAFPKARLPSTGLPVVELLVVELLNDWFPKGVCSMPQL
jgi:hypothetical protein